MRAGCSAWLGSGRIFRLKVGGVIAVVLALGVLSRGGLG